MGELFTAAMVTLFVSFSGEVTVVSEVPYDTIQECEAHKRQKEYTERMTQEGFKVFLCELR